MNILVSACLLGVACKYSGGDNASPAVLALAGRHTLIPVCPEVYGGLPTPRPPAERRGNCVVTEQGDDVTAQYMDVEARLENLKAQRTRLQQLQQQAETLSDLLEIESSLTEVQSQIESWQSQMDWYSNQVEQCTVCVSLSEVKTYSPPSEGFVSRMADAFASGWQNFAQGVQQLAVFLAGAWPVVVIAAAVAGILLKNLEVKGK